MKLSWLKLSVDILDDQKIKIIRKLPSGDTLIVLWIGILCLAMRATNPGLIEISDGIPASAEDLSTILDIDLNTVRMGIETFKRLNMIDFMEGNSIEVINFRKHQSLDKIEIQREQNALRVAKHRAQKRLTPVTHYTVTGNDIELDKIKIENKKENKDSSAIASEWNRLFPKSQIKSLTKTRHSKYLLRLREGLSLAEIAEHVSKSAFLRGETGKWRMTFDWLVENSTNWVKVVEGNYDDKVNTSQDTSRASVEAFKAAIGQI